jgi:nitrous oxide reductase accessory protein NosL
VSNESTQSRRDALKTLMAAGAVALTPGVAGAAGCPDDGTPLQFQPKTAPDPEPLVGELDKYPKCPYCGMDRRQFHHRRHLVHYGDGRADGTCSLHCAALSIALNIDLAPKAVYAADFGSAEAVKPLVDAEKAAYLVGSKIPAVMSGRSKVAFASREAAEAAMAKEGGEVTGFDGAVKAAYLDMAADTAMIRTKREERRRKAAQGG